MFTPSEKENDTTCDVISVPPGWFGPSGAAVVNEPVIDIADPYAAHGPIEQTVKLFRVSYGALAKV